MRSPARTVHDFKYLRNGLGFCGSPPPFPGSAICNQAVAGTSQESGESGNGADVPLTLLEGSYAGATWQHADLCPADFGLGLQRAARESVHLHSGKASYVQVLICWEHNPAFIELVEVSTYAEIEMYKWGL